MFLVGWILPFFAKTGRGVLARLAALGRSFQFLVRTLCGIPYLFLKPRLVTRQIYIVGVLSLSIIVVSGLFVGMVLTLQLYFELVRFGAEMTLGLLNTIALLRELGPVIASLLFSGRACSALAAEIGLMKATEQLSGMEMMAIDPMKRIVSPRFIAGFLSVPVLSLVFCTVGIVGGYLIAVQLLGIDGGSYWSQMQFRVDFWSDVMNGVIKSFVFGFFVTWIALFQGYDAVPTAEGVSRATTNTVVIASLTILGLDFVLTALMYG
jgi:phospholipid/cholesterol/gamma-HCH transport system permease protein